MEVDSDPKNFSLAELIAKDKKGKGGGANTGRKQNRPQSAKPGGQSGNAKNLNPRSGRGVAATDRQGGRPRFQKGDLKGGKPNLFRAKRTNNMIGKRKEQLNPEQKRPRAEMVSKPGSGRTIKSGGEQQRRFDRVAAFQVKRGAAQVVRGGGPRPRRQPVNERGGLARGPKKVLAAPKRQKTLRIGPKKVEAAKKPQMRQSQYRLKVRNIDEKQVTNDDLKKLFAKIGELRMCRFDRNEFGQFLGSATVTYTRPEHAKKAILEYHNAFLDDKVLTVEYDMDRVKKAQLPFTNNQVGSEGGGPQIRKATGAKSPRVNK